MSNLNHYVRQLRPRTESYANHVDRVQDLLSEKIQKISANRGDVAEAILGAAVAAKFIKRPTDTVTLKDVESILAKVIIASPVETSVFDLEKVANIKDNIKFRVGLPKRAMDFISDRSNWQNVDDLFNSSIAYVNGDKRLNLQARKFSKNKRENEIYVNSDGTGDQKGTKADIKLTFDGKKSVNQISLKVQGGNQFMQVAGIGFDKQEKLWNTLGIDIASAKIPYEKHIKSMQTDLTFYDRDSVNASGEAEYLRLAAEQTYKIAANHLQTSLDNKDGNTIKKIADLIKSGATKDENVEVVKLERGKFSKAKFGKKYYENVKNSDLVVSYKRTTDPILLVYDKKLGPSKGKLVQFRAAFKIESSTSKGKKTYKPYLRNYVESGPLLFVLASDK